MYFESRAKAGEILAGELEKYRYEDCVVVALNDGAVLVGEKISVSLHCLLTLLLMESISIPGENMDFGGVTEGGRFTYSSDMSPGEAEYYTMEFNGYLQDAKREAFSKINKLLSDGGLIDPDMVRGRIVFLVSDSFVSTAAIDVALDFLKPIYTQKIVAVAPTATVAAIDKLHVSVDEMHILDVKQQFVSVDHYFEDNNIPSHEDTVKKINDNVLNWR